MATTNYSLPTINGTDTVNGVDAINGLANAVDAALKSVANSIPNLDNINSQLATLQQQVTSASGTANQALSTATSASSNATNALSTANNVNQAWNAAPANVLQDSVYTYVQSADALTAYSWGNVVTIKLTNVRNLPYNQGTTIGHVKNGYWPTADILGTCTIAQTSGSQWAFFKIQASDGAIVVNPSSDGTEAPGGATVVGTLAYLCHIE